MDIQICQATPNYIHSVVIYKDRNIFFDCSFVYGHPVERLRRSLWGALQKFQINSDVPWCSLGDFNEMLAQHEKKGLRPQNQRGMDDFRIFLNNTGLMDLDLKGNKFTWLSNPRSGVVIKEKLDRVLANWSFRSMFPNAIAEGLPFISSDHAPILFHIDPKGRSGRCFKYEAFWEDHEECREVVDQG